MTTPIPGPGITPEAAEALGLEPTDPRIVIDSDAVDDDGISDPFPSLTFVENVKDVPPELSSGDTIPDAGIGESSGEPSVDPRTEGSPRKRVSRLHADSSSSSGPRDASSKPPTLDEWTNFFGKIVLKTVCNWYLDFAFRGIDQDAVTDKELDRLSMTDDERKVIVTPIAELSNKSKFMRKHGRTMVASGESFQAMVIMGAWISRVNRIASKYRQQQQPRIRVNGMSSPNGNNGQTTPSANGTSYTTGTSNGRVPNGYPVYRSSSG